MDEPTRACRECKRILPLSDYYRDKRGPSGYRSNCKDCHKAAVMDRARANPEQVRFRQAVYRADPEHRRLARERTARYRAEKPEAVQSAQQRYRSDPEHQQLARERARAWRIANPERRAEQAGRRRALQRSSAATRIPMALLAAKLAYWGWCCWMCGGEPSTWDHVKPLAKGGAHLLANLRPACGPCNGSKKARWPYPMTGGLAWRKVATASAINKRTVTVGS